MTKLTIKYTVKGTALTYPELEKRVAKGLNRFIDLCEIDYKMCVRTWKHKPRFVKQRAKKMGDIIRASVGTDDENFARVSEGTGPRSIVSRSGKKPMRFQVGYHAKTVPGSIGSGRSSRFGPWRRTHKVKAHSIVPRHFTEAIAARRFLELGRLVEEEIKKK